MTVWSSHFETVRVILAREDNKQVLKPPEMWASLTLFQSEIGTYYIKNTGKQRILFNLFIPLIVFPTEIGKHDDEIHSIC